MTCEPGRPRPSARAGSASRSSSRPRSARSGAGDRGGHEVGPLHAVAARARPARSPWCGRPRRTSRPAGSRCSGSTRVRVCRPCRWPERGVVDAGEERGRRDLEPTDGDVALAVARHRGRGVGVAGDERVGHHHRARAGRGRARSACTRRIASASAASWLRDAQPPRRRGRRRARGRAGRRPPPVRARSSSSTGVPTSCQRVRRWTPARVGEPGVEAEPDGGVVVAAGDHDRRPGGRRAARRRRRRARRRRPAAAPGRRRPRRRPPGRPAPPSTVCDQVVDERRLGVEQPHPVEGAAQVPVGGVEDAHTETRRTRAPTDPGSHAEAVRRRRRRRTSPDRRKPTSAQPGPSARSTARLDGAPTAASTPTPAATAFCTISKPMRPLTREHGYGGGTRRPGAGRPTTLSTALCRPMSSRTTSGSPVGVEQPGGVQAAGACRRPSAPRAAGRAGPCSTSAATTGCAVARPGGRDVQQRRARRRCSRCRRHRTPTTRPTTRRSARRACDRGGRVELDGDDVELLLGRRASRPCSRRPVAGPPDRRAPPRRTEKPGGELEVVARGPHRDRRPARRVRPGQAQPDLERLLGGEPVLTRRRRPAAPQLAHPGAHGRPGASAWTHARQPIFGSNHQPRTSRTTGA